jgi:predicted GNAT superfamily acetyltransferase
MIVRHAKADDADTITALNEVFVSVTSPMDSERFRELFKLSSYCLVAEAPNEVLGFVMAMTNGAPYDNGNYKWFDDRVSDMVYVDRIVLASEARGQGVGRVLYRYLSELALGAGCSVMTAEMDIDPPNAHSVHFHRMLGFAEIGQRTLDSGKRVSMQSVALSEATFV